MNTATPELEHWVALTAEEQREAVRRMAADGVSDYAISAATRLAIEQVRQIIGYGACEACDA